MELVAQAGGEQANIVEMTMMVTMTPTNVGRRGIMGRLPRQPMARKEPRKQGTVYPPVNRNLAPLYISRRKERTELGYRILEWTDRRGRSQDARSAGEAT